MKRMIVLAFVLVVFMFAATIVVPTISMPRSVSKINRLDQTLSIEDAVPYGDPIDGGPPAKN